VCGDMAQHWRWVTGYPAAVCGDVAQHWRWVTGYPDNFYRFTQCLLTNARRIPSDRRQSPSNSYQPTIHDNLPSQ
jgi:hypothetical protein